MNSLGSNRLDESANYNLTGHLLVASPNWQHELYGRSVCLVVHHSSQRAIGVVLNRHLPMSSGDLWQKLAGDKPV
ncbi:MAG: YqgE/AlgH family protein, partial [Aureliella sp.]